MSLPGAEQSAMDARLDVRIASLETEAIARTLGLTKTTRFINVLDAGYVNESETGNARKNGYEIALELPLFDWGTARVARAEAQYRQAIARAAEVAVVARSEVRAGYATIALPTNSPSTTATRSCRCASASPTKPLLRYNAMLIGVFELLADAREQVASVNTAIEATRDFWLADTALQLALTGKTPGDGATRCRRGRHRPQPNGRPWSLDGDATWISNADRSSHRLAPRCSVPPP